MKTKLSKFALVCIVVIGLTFPGISFAQTSIFDSFVEAFQKRVDNFKRQIEDLRERLSNRDMEIQSSEDRFTEYLYEGQRGNQVTKLQEFLSQYPDIYPEGKVTGKFGPETKNAVMRFQERYGIPPVGYVGPETRSKLNELLERQSSKLSTTSKEDVSAPGPEMELREDEVSAVQSQENNYKLNPRPEYEIKKIESSIQQEINERRLNNNLKSINWNDDISEVARRHSQDQADDSRSLVDSDKPCAFPILRHAGFDSGLTVGDRLSNEGIEYRKAGENLVLFSLSKNMVYRYNVSEGKPGSCPQVDVVEFSSADTAKEKRDILNEEINVRKIMLENTPEVEWTNKEWRGANEVAEKAVDMWLNSEGHRENLLSKEFNKGGVGVDFAGDFIIITHVMVK